MDCFKQSLNDMPNYKDLTGKRFGRLEAINFAGRRKGRSRWLCRCDCGKRTTVDYGNLTSKFSTTKSCGCLRKDNQGKTNLRHGLAQTKFYRAWGHARGRCNNRTDHGYPLYGERGIKFMWKIFADFQKDMYASFLKHIKEAGEKNTTLDRIDVNGHYCKKNCRWATWKEQQNNRRNTGKNKFTN